MSYIPAAVLAVVFILTAFRRFGGLRLGIWQIMLGGAAVVLITGSITPERALASINPDVMVFLAGMFIIGEALVESGYLYHMSRRVFRRARGTDTLVLLSLLLFGSLSAVLMNDTIAVIGAPLAIHLAKRHGVSPKLLLLALCFSITIGSVPSPIGNPQNLIIAMEGSVRNPFVTFARHLLVPSIINMFIAYLVLRLIYRKEFKGTAPADVEDAVRDPRLARLARLSLILVVLMAALKIADVTLGLGLDIRLTYIAVVPALPLLVLAPGRATLIRNMDWPTLVFFASLFVLMASVWDSGVIQPYLGKTGPGAPGAVLGVSVVASQVLSNVPFVLLYLPAIAHPAGAEEALMALAAGSTVAGNLLVLGAASNVIVIQGAEKRGVHLSFFEFARAGVPLTALNVIVYLLFL